MGSAGAYKQWEGGVEGGYDQDTLHACMTKLDLQLCQPLADSLERLSHTCSQQIPVSTPSALGLETHVTTSASYRGTGHLNSDQASLASHFTQ